MSSPGEHTPGEHTPGGVRPSGYRLTVRRLTQREAGPLAFALHLAQRARGDAVLRAAGALSYTSLLAVVPFLTLALAALGLFPVFEDARGAVQGFIFDNFVPTVGTTLHRNLARFIGAAGRLTLVGTLGLTVTAVLLLVSIERTFNVIFRVRRARPLVLRILLYWAFLTVGPLLLGGMFSLASWVMALGLRDQGVPVLLDLLAVMAPGLVTFAGLIGLYYLVPNRRVRLWDALLAAAVAAGLFWLLRAGFVAFISNVRTYESIYGTLAVAPLFLVWIYLSWVVVLCGAELAAALPEWRLRRIGLTDHGGLGRLVMALDLLRALEEATPRGAGLDRTGLLAVTALSEDAVILLLQRLSAAHFVARAENGRWVSTRSSHDATVQDLLLALEIGLPDSAVLEQAALERAVMGPALTDALSGAARMQAVGLSIPLDRVMWDRRPGGGAGRH
ncbi:YihY family inner membrane protein [Novispirillum itersonii]|uniref:UPF0761 membrane protein FHS48_001728 n=1 Tax=Novispirillum itersonii TaxID=189 RepID=A0A7W9ZFU0_NOVIT|nr:YihY family inner membrane protein [Novispirillum itersonii]MBB6210313.1 membrane protein [Novispirillum itersonii]